MRISDWSSDVCSSDLLVKPSPNPCPFSPIFAVYQIFCITEPKSSSSEGSSFGFANGLETQVSLIRSRQVMLLLVLLPPQEPQPSEKVRSEEHTSELQSLMRISYAVFCLKKKKHTT